MRDEDWKSDEFSQMQEDGVRESLLDYSSMNVCDEDCVSE